MLTRKDKRKIDRMLKNEKDTGRLFNNVLTNFSINVEILEYISDNCTFAYYGSDSDRLSKIITDALILYSNPEIGQKND